MSKKFGSFVLVFGICAVASVKAAYKIEATIEGAEKAKAYLARYKGINLVNIDSAVFSKKNTVIFADAKATLPGGLYVMRFTVAKDGDDGDSRQQQIEFIVSGQNSFKLGISANTLNIEKSLQYTLSAENEGFKKYIDGQRRMGRKIQALQNRYRNFQNNPDSVHSIQAQYAALMEAQKKQVEILEVTYKGTLMATLIKCTQEPEIPEMPLPQNATNVDSIRQRQFLEFAKAHFFDNFNLADERIVNAPMLENRMIAFFQQLLLREPAEDINSCINRLLDKARQNKAVYRYALTWLYDRYTDSPVEGHHVVGMHLCSIMSDSTKVDWLTDKEKSKLKQNIRKYTLNPIGSIATDLKLQTSDGEYRSLHALKAPITILYFFNPGCGTCRMTTPALHEMYGKYREKGLEVFAVYPDKDTAAWKGYVEENGYTDWVNVWDAEGTADIYEKYSLHAIPQLYVLDEEKKVRYKDVYIENLDSILYVIFSQIHPTTRQHEHEHEHEHEHNHN
ncbi:MAG: redoxin domain-containing protein [Prevotellaceae bacterium]|jgi:thiol-disulfide isomerase/thioredoxin|nr:redoxin domain-containing protein [Prevotellaceae bacterium]